VNAVKRAFADTATMVTKAKFQSLRHEVHQLMDQLFPRQEGVAGNQSQLARIGRGEAAGLLSAFTAEEHASGCGFEETPREVRSSVNEDLVVFGGELEDLIPSLRGSEIRHSPYPTSGRPPSMRSARS
jgi:hypothetical protein